MKKKICTTLSVITLVLFYVMPIFAQTDSKVAFLTVSGSGKTKQEALNSALRSAIEQAFGTFISSNTQILNDKLTKDEIVSVSNGNIQEYTVISEVQTPDGNWSNTVKAKVAVDKLTSFCESKGVKVEFKGSLFSLNIKQQILNEENELTVIENAVKVAHDIFDKSFDFEVKAGEPTQSGSNFKIPLSISVRVNDNITNATNYIYTTLEGLSLSSTEIENYTQLQKPVSPIVFAIPGNQNVSQNAKKNKKSNDASKGTLTNVFYLRNHKSIDCIVDCINYIRHSVTYFSINNDIETITGKALFTCKSGRDDINYYATFNTSYFNPIKYDQSNDRFFPKNNDGCRGIKLFYTDVDRNGNVDYLGKDKRIADFYWSRSDNSGSIPRAGSVIRQGGSIRDPNNTINGKFIFINSLTIKPTIYWGSSQSGSHEHVDAVITLADLKAGDLITVITFNDYKTLDQVSKISAYTISPNK